MNDIKDYRNNELKNYVIGNILLVLYFSGIQYRWMSDTGRRSAIADGIYA